MSRKYVLLLLSLSLMFGLFSCSTQQKPIMIGYVGGLSNAGSDLGVNGMYGALLAVEQINNQGGVLGKKIELVIKNDQSDPEIALQVDQELIDEGCSIIIGHMISGVALNTVPLINSSKTLMISPTIATDELSGIDDNFLRVIPSNKSQVELLIETIKNQQVKRLGILFSSNNLLFAQPFITLNGNDFGVINKFEFEKASKINYASMIQTFLTLNIDGLLIIASGDEVATIAQQFQLLDYHPLVYLPAWAMTNDLITLGGKEVDGFLGVTYIKYDSTQLDYLNFKTEFVEKFGMEPNFGAIMAYESVMLAVNAIENSSSFDSMVIKDEILNNNTYFGLFGDLIIDQFGDSQRGIKLLQITDGKFIEVIP